MRSLEARLSRLEAKHKAKYNRAPSLAEYLDVLPRHWARLGYNARLKLYRMSGREDELWQKLSDHDRKILEKDTPELQAKDEDVMQRSEGVHWQESGHAARAKLRLRSMERVTVME